MSRSRLTRTDVITLLVAAVLAVAGIALTFRFHSEASPAASIDFKVSRSEIEQREKRI